VTTTASPIPPGTPDPLTAAAWLDGEERRIRRALGELRAAGVDVQSEQDDLGELAPASQHPADVGSETLEREVDLGLINDFQRLVDEITAARNRLAAGRYGICEHCHARVAPARLEAVPATRFCRPCAEQVERLDGLRLGGGRRAVLVSDEFLARDDIGDEDLEAERSAEERAVHIRPAAG
jgi:RNA polymerase-binding transcription factor DksA